MLKLKQGCRIQKTGDYNSRNTAALFQFEGSNRNVRWVAQFPFWVMQVLGNPVRGFPSKCPLGCSIRTQLIFELARVVLVSLDAG